MAKDYERRAKKQKKLPTNHIPQKKYSTEIDGNMFPSSYMIQKERNPTEDLKYNVKDEIKKIVQEEIEGAKKEVKDKVKKKVKEMAKPFVDDSLLIRHLTKKDKD